MKEKIQINIKAHPAATEIHVDMLHISKHLSVITIEKLHVFTVEVILVIRLLAFNENEYSAGKAALVEPNIFILP